VGSDLSSLTTLITYYVFSVWLKCQFPSGFFITNIMGSSITSLGFGVLRSEQPFLRHQRIGRNVSGGTSGIDPQTLWPPPPATFGATDCEHYMSREFMDSVCWIYYLDG
jgi:hypothetical protein